MTLKEIGEMIKTMRQSRNMSQEKLAKAVGVSQSSVNMWEHGDRKPSDEAIEAMADVFNVPKWALLYREDELRPNVPNVYSVTDAGSSRVTIVDSVSGGNPVISSNVFKAWFDSQVDSKFAIKMEGDAMEPTFRDGDIVYIKDTVHVEDGGIAAVIYDDKAIIRRIHTMPEGLLFTGDNITSKPICVKNNGYEVVRILGIPVGFTRMF